MVTIQREFEECDVAPRLALRVLLWEKVKFSLNKLFGLLLLSVVLNSTILPRVIISCCIVVSHVYTVQCILI